ncbi:hypothetical protein GP486_007119 [Trichoglossum hirsutum]|uniref:Uncharacterized protein n=1 Tax=Trichoglossum hirsutum TaxID=265104 RepID=A0A9P8IIJ3_9PEZI|nr:hypothetical protein GP486_007119 [Trichoglossum hirsutum]
MTRRHLHTWNAESPVDSSLSRGIHTDERDGKASYATKGETIINDEANSTLNFTKSDLKGFAEPDTTSEPHFLPSLIRRDTAEVISYSSYSIFYSGSSKYAINEDNFGSSS